MYVCKHPSPFVNTLLPNNVHANMAATSESTRMLHNSMTNAAHSHKLCSEASAIPVTGIRDKTVL
jgi:hypothetical protein